MKKLYSFVNNTALVAVLLLFVAAATLKLYPQLRTFDTRQVVMNVHENTDTSGRLLDEILLENLASFNYIRSFDHLLKQGVHSVDIRKKLWIDRCEVRQGDFYKFAQWYKFNRDKTVAAPMQPRGWQYQSNNRKHVISGRLDAPANGITYYDAYAYCASAGGRLPSRYEWIAAASGRDSRLYPWGNRFNDAGWPYLDPLLNAAQRCNVHKETSTPDKIHDMGGNVSEWASNPDNPLKPVIMGGNAFNVPREIYSLNALHRFAPVTYRSPYIGFRCVYSKPIRQLPWKTPVKAAVIPKNRYTTSLPADAKIPNLLAQLPPQQYEVIPRIFRQNKSAQDKKLFVMRHEVTRAMYEKFLADPFAGLGLYADKNQPKNHSYEPPDWNRQLEQPALPVTNVDWWSAHAFAAWAGGKLLSAEEWMIAVSGQGKHIYPWGNEFPASDRDKERYATQAEAARRPGEDQSDLTEQGLWDMAGNLSEWTQSVATQDGAYAIVIKGGNYLLPAKEPARMDFNNYVPPHYRSPTLGFRVAFDQPRLRFIGF